MISSTRERECDRSVALAHSERAATEWHPPTSCHPLGLINPSLCARDGRFARCWLSAGWLDQWRRAGRSVAALDLAHQRGTAQQTINHRPTSIALPACFMLVSHATATGQHSLTTVASHLPTPCVVILPCRRLLTDQVDERTMAKYEKEAKEKNRESWYLAYIMDTNEEERAKGKTVEVGRAHFTTAKKRYTLLDAPGHKNYVPNMIGGASQADVGVLVISARKGEFESGFDRGGQTREHAMLAKTLGLQKLVVLVNKMDEKEVSWRKERYDQIEAALSPFLKKCGFNMKTG